MDALTADPTQVFYNLNWKASTNEQVALNAAQIFGGKGLGLAIDVLVFGVGKLAGGLLMLPDLYKKGT